MEGRGDYRKGEGRKEGGRQGVKGRRGQREQRDKKEKGDIKGRRIRRN